MNEIIDLSYVIEEKMITYPKPWHSKVKIKQLAHIEIEGRETREITFGTHTGTHIDAPLHFIKNGKGVDDIPLEKLVGEVSIVDFSHFKSNQCVTKEILKSVKLSKRMLFRFGWEKFWGNLDFYKNHPYFSEDAVKYMIQNGVMLIGFDIPSPDNSKNDSCIDSPIHKILLEKEIIILEYVANMDKIEQFLNWKIVVAPLKIKNTDGCPARVFIYR